MKILIVDDERELRMLIKACLEADDHEVEDCHNGLEAITLHRSKTYDLILLDMNMPYMNGLQTFRELRLIRQVPVIFLTAEGDISVEVQCLEAGASDFIQKPFRYKRLAARINACFERMQDNRVHEITVGDLRVNMTNRQVFVDERPVRLTQKEYEVLEILIRNKNRLLQRGVLLDQVWGYSYEGSQRTVDTHIKTLRAKMGSSGAKIKTVRGVGYYMDV